MKSLLAMALLFAVVGVSFSQDKITDVKIGDSEYHDINDVHMGVGGLVIIRFPTGGTSTKPDKLPAGFLESWGITQEMQDAAKTAQDKAAADSLERAIRSGSFRLVDGVVYDIRKPQSGWVTLANTKVLQIFGSGAIVDSSPDVMSSVALYVKHLPKLTSDRDIITFSAKPTGTYTYENKLGDERTVRAYDLGRICKREEIPASVLEGKKAFDTMLLEGTPSKDVLATLPNSDELRASGTGFFITDDGFLITNNHVVRGAKRVSIKTAAGVFPATVIQTDKEHDLALLKASGKFKPLPISNDSVQLGQAVFTIGFPNIDMQGTEPKYTDGKVSSLMGIKDDPKEYQISVPVQPGNSGGPLVNNDGSVVGIVVARLDDMAALVSSGSLPQNVNYAVKVEFLMALVAHHAEVKLVPQIVLKSNELVPSVQRSVAMVLVY